MQTILWSGPRCERLCGHVHSSVELEMRAGLFWSRGTREVGFPLNRGGHVFWFSLMGLNNGKVLCSGNGNGKRVLEACELGDFVNRLMDILLEIW